MGVVASGRTEKVKASNNPNNAKTAPSIAGLSEGAFWRLRNRRPNSRSTSMSGSMKKTLIGWKVIRVEPR